MTEPTVETPTDRFVAAFQDLVRETVKEPPNVEPIKDGDQDFDLWSPQIPCLLFVAIDLAAVLLLLQPLVESAWGKLFLETAEVLGGAALIALVGNLRREVFRRAKSRLSLGVAAVFCVLLVGPQVVAASIRIHAGRRMVIVDGKSSGSRNQIEVQGLQPHSVVVQELVGTTQFVDTLRLDWLDVLAGIASRPFEHLRKPLELPVRYPVSFGTEPTDTTLMVSGVFPPRLWRTMKDQVDYTRVGDRYVVAFPLTMQNGVQEVRLPPGTYDLALNDIHTANCTRQVAVATPSVGADGAARPTTVIFPCHAAQRPVLLDQR
jgi:hypothetical protein